jgi:hypothetical protein
MFLSLQTTKMIAFAFLAASAVLFLVVFPAIRQKWVKSVFVFVYLVLIVGLYFIINPELPAADFKMADLEQELIFAFPAENRIYVAFEDEEYHVVFQEYRKVLGVWVSFNREAEQYAYFESLEAGQLFFVMYRYALPEDKNVVYFRVAMIYDSVGSLTDDVVFVDDATVLDEIVTEYPGYHYIGVIGALQEDSEFDVMGFSVTFSEMEPLNAQ